MTVDKTRQVLLKAAFSEIHRQGFQSASLSAILHNTGVTKGALYHYFQNKKALGYAVLDEWIQPYLITTWIEPLKRDDIAPLGRLKQTISDAGNGLDETDIQLGCPLNNLAQEMSPIDEGFRQRTDAIYQIWLKGIANTLREGQEDGSIRADIKAEDAALFIVAALEGCMSIAKNAQSREALMKCGNGVLGYLDSLAAR
jgi:AcrR family transcriptional regulator